MNIDAPSPHASNPFAALAASGLAELNLNSIDTPDGLVEASIGTGFDGRPVDSVAADLVESLDGVSTLATTWISEDAGCLAYSATPGEILVSLQLPDGELTDVGLVLPGNFGLRGAILHVEIDPEFMNKVVESARPTDLEIDALGIAIIPDDESASEIRRFECVERGEMLRVDELLSLDGMEDAIGDLDDETHILIEVFEAPMHGRISTVSRIELDELTGAPLRSVRAVLRQRPAAGLT